MKKSLLMLCLGLSTMLVFAGCNQLSDASNEEIQDVVSDEDFNAENEEETVIECTEHQWIDATCTEPKTCSICGITEGEPLGHDFAPATVDSAKKCKICGVEEGEPVKVTIIEVPEGFYNHSMYGIFSENFVCGDFTDAVDGGCFEIELFDLQGNKVIEDCYLCPSGGVGVDEKWSHFCGIDPALDLIYWFVCDPSNKAQLVVYKVEGNELVQIFSSAVNDGEYKTVQDGDQKVIIDNEKYYGVSVGGYTFVYDIENNCLCSKEDIVKDEEPEYDDSLWSYYKEVPIIDGYYVGTKDMSSWGFLDKRTMTCLWLLIYFDEIDYFGIIFLGWAFLFEVNIFCY